MLSNLILNTYIEVGATACQQGHTNLADQMFKAALGESERLGNTGAQHAAMLVNIASVCVQQKNYRKAETFYKMALATYCNTLGQHNEQVSSTLDSLAKLSLMQGKYGQAEQFYVRAQRTDERACNTNRKRLANRLRKLVYVYLKRSKYRQADEAMKSAQCLDSITEST